jgi:hypothetical protein
MSSNPTFLPFIAEEKRTFALDRGEFGTVQRRYMLGLKSPSPQVQLDDNTSVAYFGSKVPATLVDTETGSDGLGNTHPLPLDVKMVGYLYLSQMGFTAEQQQQLLFAWRSMTSAQQQSYTDAWAAVNKSDAAAVQAYVTGLVTFLQSQSP